MPASSTEPTGLPRTPGNPGRPWRGRKTEEGGSQERVGGGGQGVRTVLEEGKQTTQKEDTDEEREEVRVRCQPHSCKQLQSKDP